MTDTSAPALLGPFDLSPGLHLRNRVVLAPCTRNRATADLAPTEGAIAHYAGRAGAGLLISEEVLVSGDAQGYWQTPGLFLDSHERAWAKVAEAVHTAGGLMFVQLWHTGRMAHSHWTGRAPLAPSAVLDPAPRRQAGGVQLHHEMPVAMTEDDIHTVIAAYFAAATRARRAGFDGVEIHGANGYLPEQFLRAHTNRRTDGWGGSPDRNARFTLALVDACGAVFGADRVGLRLSPAAYFSEMRWSAGDNETYVHLLGQLATRPLAYLHTGMVDDIAVDYLGETSTQFLRRHWRGTLIGNGGYSVDSAQRHVAAGAFDLIAFGKLFLANPDLVQRIQAGLPLRPYSRELLDALT